MRTDQVGSLLRPQALLDARAAWQAGRLSEAGLRQLEDEAILTALRAQEAAGQQIYVDGESSAESGITTGFPDSVEGFVPDAYVPIAWKGGTGVKRIAEHSAGDRPTASAKETDCKERSRFSPKACTRALQAGALPSPVNFAVIFWRLGVSDRAYETPSEFLSDAAHILASEARALAGEGTPYLQLDAPLYTHWADGSLKAKYGKLGFEMDRFLDDAVAAENAVLDAAAPAVTGVHLCRGNSMGRWLAEGGYDPIAKQLFNELRCDRLLLEYDSPRRATSRRCVMSQGQDRRARLDYHQAWRSRVA